MLNLYIIQIEKNIFFNNLAQQQYTTLVTAYPSRAEIVDRHGLPLALNTTCLSAFIIPSKITQLPELNAFLVNHFPAAAERLARVRRNSTHFMYVKRRLDERDIKAIEESALKDIRFLKEARRFYPIEAASTVVGMTDIDNKGMFGMEKLYDTHLAGSPSLYFLEQEGHSKHYHFNKKAQIQGKEGMPLMLTLDGTLQFLAQEEAQESVKQLHAVEAAVLIMDPMTGDILAMAQYPGFNPNGAIFDIEATKNKLVTEAYELGSVIKIFFALAALEEGVVSPDELVDCENKESTFINGFKINTVKAHGLLTFSQTIERSNNIGTCKIAQRLGTLLYQHYRKCGFGQKTGLIFPGQQKGYVNAPAQWNRRSIFSLSFGYEISATLLQLAIGCTLLATNGHLVTPRLVLKPSESPVLKSKQPLYKPETIATMRDILQKTVTRGTAYRARIKGYQALGKTGTANVLVDGVYQPTKNIFTFAGLIEKGDYKRIIITFIKETDRQKVTATTTAVPLFERVAQKMLIHDKII